MAAVISTVVMLVAISAAFYTQSSEPTPLETMVETERSFAKSSFDRGTREAFLSFIADDGVLFRPTAVNGKQWLLDNPGPSGPKRSLLAWRPTFADVSAAGDLGYTTGPWEFKSDINEEKPVAFGHFITVWKRQPDGPWKFVIDLGISHSRAGTSDVEWRPSPQANLKHSQFKTDIGEERARLSRREREFLEAVSTGGAGKAFLQFAAKHVRVFRENHTPIVGSAAVGNALKKIGRDWTWETALTAVSNSGDLGYSYGSYEVRARETEKGNYLRIWKKEDGVWQVVVDVANPLPKG